MSGDMLRTAAMDVPHGARAEAERLWDEGPNDSNSNNYNKVIQ